METKMITLTIDGVSVTVPEGTTVLEAAKAAKISIPTLCYLKGVNQIGACRICMVEIEGARGLAAACVMPASEGMVVRTNTAKLRQVRKDNLELLLSNHNRECTSCVRSGSCELQALANEYGITNSRYVGEKTFKPTDIDEVSPSIVRDNSKCIHCRRCIATCQNVQRIGAIGMGNRGFKSTVGPAFGVSLASSPCVNCGQCIEACPVGALHEKSEIDNVWAALADPEKYVVVQPAPAVRASLGEEFGMPIGTGVTGKMVASMRRLGFDKVFDTDFGADLTIIEEGTELINRIQNNGVLPMITSCSPGWITYCEKFFPEFIPNLSSCKSPHEMTGALIKSYYAEKMNIDPAKIYVVSVMPCTAKKYEAQRPELKNKDGLRDVDAVLTVREYARMVKAAGIDFVDLEDEDFDSILGESTGAAVIFGATGGVMEAALRTVYAKLTGKELENIDLHDVRGFEGIKEAEVDINGTKVAVAVAHGTGNAEKLLKAVKAGEKNYAFIEIMCCPGGCITGGGQPIVNAKKLMSVNVKQLRAKVLYDEDASKPKRKSHENAEVMALYKDFLGEPNGHKAHELLHTTYSAKEKFKK